uniref:Uncharacterized protein n=1 Tax=Panagrolaimus superbus TaxID=310955 RepID=A0A914YHH8_9BILA
MDQRSEEFTASDDFKTCEKCNGTCAKTCNLNIDDNNPRQLDFGSVREIYPYYSYQNFDESENPIDENNLCKIIIGDLQITENTFHSVGGRGALPYSSLWFFE